MSQTTVERPDRSDPDLDPASTPPADPRATHRRLEELERGIGRHDRGVGILLGLAFAVMIGSVIAIGLIQRNSDGGGGAGAAAGQSVTAELTEFTIVLSATEVTPNSTITATNTGTMAHTIGVRGTDLVTDSIAPGGTATLDLSGLEPGEYTIYCDIPGHPESGMETPLTIGGQGAASDAAAMGMTAEEHAAMGDHAGMTPEEGMAMDQVMVESIMAFPAETQGLGNQPLAPTVLADGTKHFQLTTSIVDWEVSPGKIVQAWAYNGMVPGPRIDLEVGDKVQIELINELPIGTDIHMHGIDLPNDQDGVAPITQDLVPSGGTYTYEFTATDPAIGMYHAHAHGDEAIPNGLFGTMYIGHIPPPAGRTVSGIEIPDDITIAQDIPMVVNDAGTIGLSLNGKSFPATAPIFAKQGDWITVTYYNEGLQVHPMHLHGFEQIVYAKDGEPLDAPYAADTILVSPGERYTVLFNADQVGTWVWHCHILNHAESAEGMFGMVTAIIVE